MNNLPTFSYATAVWNEHEELDRLLTQLLSIIDPYDEIVIQGDQGKVTNAVVSVLHRYKNNPQVKYIEYPLRKNFAQFKNNLFKNCEKDYIVNIDADELLSASLSEHLKAIISINPDIDMFRMPRINIVDGLTKELVNAWRWSVNSAGWVNWPDYQSRIIKNHLGIKWQNLVHEVLVGYKTSTEFPADPDFALIHVKSVDRQVKQNDFYSSIGQ
jgi:glycosyltransferase involved in cell wall biosynthesis